MIGGMDTRAARREAGPAGGSLQEGCRSGGTTLNEGEEMMLRIGMLAAVGLVLAQPAWAAGMFDEPYGRIESGDRSVNRRQEPVAINRIDGVTTRNTRRPDPVAPGKRAVEISFASARVPTNSQLQTMEIDVEPCKRYRVVAHVPNRAASGNWEPVVQAVEDIGECRRKFMSGAPKK
jgi:hypothetical protein